MQVDDEVCIRPKPAGRSGTLQRMKDLAEKHIVLGLTGGIVGWVAVSLIRARHNGEGEGIRPQQPIYPPVMIFPGQAAPGGNYLPPATGNGTLETIPGPRTFTIIGDDDD